MDDFINQILNPDLKFMAMYISVVVIIAYIGLFFMYINIKQLKLENAQLKQHLQTQNSSITRQAGINTGIDLNKQ